MTKQKIIFLDIDGVLNGLTVWHRLGWKIFSHCKSNKLRSWYKTTFDPWKIDDSKVKKLAKIIHKTNANVVMSSSWRHGWWGKPYDQLWEDQKRLTDLLHKYDIQIIDITPTSMQHQRDREIITWLSRNESSVEQFIILDDERDHLKVFLEDERFIVTANRCANTFFSSSGLNNKHVKKAIKILNKTPLTLLSDRNSF